MYGRDYLSGTGVVEGDDGVEGILSTVDEIYCSAIGDQSLGKELTVPWNSSYEAFHLSDHQTDARTAARDNGRDMRNIEKFGPV